MKKDEYTVTAALADVTSIMRAWKRLPVEDRASAPIFNELLTAIIAFARLNPREFSIPVTEARSSGSSRTAMDHTLAMLADMQAVKRSAGAYSEFITSLVRTLQEKAIKEIATSDLRVINSALKLIESRRLQMNCPGTNSTLSRAYVAATQAGNTPGDLIVFPERLNPKIHGWPDAKEEEIVARALENLQHTYPTRYSASFSKAMETEITESKELEFAKWDLSFCKEAWALVSQGRRQSQARGVNPILYNLARQIWKLGRMNAEDLYFLGNAEMIVSMNSSEASLVTAVVDELFVRNMYRVVCPYTSKILSYLQTFVKQSASAERDTAVLLHNWEGIITRNSNQENRRTRNAILVNALLASALLGRLPHNQSKMLLLHGKVTESNPAELLAVKAVLDDLTHAPRSNDYYGKMMTMYLQETVKKVGALVQKPAKKDARIRFGRSRLKFIDRLETPTRPIGMIHSTKSEENLHYEEMENAQRFGEL